MGFQSPLCGAGVGRASAGVGEGGGEHATITAVAQGGEDELLEKTEKGGGVGVRKACKENFRGGGDSPPPPSGKR